MERVADYIIDRLTQQKIDKIFLVTGRGILYLTDAVARNTHIEGVPMYHEQGASYAAMAYAAGGNGMAACLVSTGCAATNAVTAALCAWQDNLPCVFISGQHMLRETTRYTGAPIRTYGSQEADIISVVSSLTKYAVMITDPQTIAKEMDKAIYLANSGRKGPVWIDIPLDVQNARVEPERLERYEIPKRDDVPVDVESAAAELEKASRPLLLIGGGAREAGAEIQRLVEDSGLPLVYTTSAADIYGSGNRLSVGTVGSLGGSRAGNFAVQNADVILAVGSKLCSQTIGAEAKEFAKHAKLTVVDIDGNEHRKAGAQIDRIITADAGDFLRQMNRRGLHLNCQAWTDRCLHWKETFAIANEEFIKVRAENDKIDLYHFADVLSDKLPDNATVITDAGFEELIIPPSIRYRPGQRCLFPSSQGAMGYAIPAIVGADGAGRENIVAVVGDGSVMMNVQELQIISQRKIPAKIFIINNNMYAVIRRRQRDLFRNRTIGNDPSDGVPAPDFKKLADAFSIQYTAIENNGELTERIGRVLGVEGACICEVMCREDQPYLHSSYALNSQRRLEKRPIDDLSPFISREKYAEETMDEPGKENR